MNSTSPFWADWLAGLSLANLCFLRVWSEMLTYSRANAFWMKAPPSRADLVSAMVNVLLWGTVFGGFLSLMHRPSPRWKAFAEGTLLVLLLLPLNAMRGILSNQYSYLKSPLFELIGQRGVLLLAAGGILTGAVILFFFHRPLARAAVVVLRVLSPLIAFTFLQAALSTVRYDPRPFAYKPLQPLLANARQQPRVVWIIFDEWDFRLTFLDRQPGLSLPAVDRLRSQALFANNAQPPGPATQISMPGLITGRLVADVRAKGPDELMLTYKGESNPVPWSHQRNFFDEARQLGFNTALLGWYHPYCRVIAHSLSECDSWEMGMQHNSMGDRFFQILPNQARSLFETNLFSPFGQSLTAQQQSSVVQTMLARGKTLVTDTRYAAILLHLPVPHAPHTYDRRRGTFTLANSPIQGYWDSLALLDRVLGELRDALETAGLWDQTTVVVSTDHHYREDKLLDGKEDLRIPFLVKLAGQKSGDDFQPPFNTILTKDLLLAVLREEIPDKTALAQWLQAHASSTF
jgi:Sulfatase